MDKKRARGGAPTLTLRVCGIYSIETRMEPLTFADNDFPVVPVSRSLSFSALKCNWENSVLTVTGVFRRRGIFERTFEGEMELHRVLHICSPGNTRRVRGDFNALRAPETFAPLPTIQVSVMYSAPHGAELRRDSPDTKDNSRKIAVIPRATENFR